MAEPTLMMFKLVTGEQIISLVKREPDLRRWSLIHPKLVISRWEESKRPTVSGSWIVGIPHEADAAVPLEYKDAILVYYDKNITEDLKAQYTYAVSR